MIYDLDEALVGLYEERVLLVPALVEQLLLLHQLLVPETRTAIDM